MLNVKHLFGLLLCVSAGSFGLVDAKKVMDGKLCGDTGNKKCFTSQITYASGLLLGATVVPPTKALVKQPLVSPLPLPLQFVMGFGNSTTVPTPAVADVISLASQAFRVSKDGTLHDLVGSVSFAVGTLAAQPPYTFTFTIRIARCGQGTLFDSPALIATTPLTTLQTGVGIVNTVCTQSNCMSARVNKGDLVVLEVSTTLTTAAQTAITALSASAGVLLTSNN